MNESVAAEKNDDTQMPALWSELSETDKQLLNAVAQAGFTTERALELFIAAKELIESPTPWESDDYYFQKRYIAQNDNIYGALQATLEVRREQLRATLETNRQMAVFAESNSRRNGLDTLTSVVVIAGALVYVTLEVLSMLRGHRY